MVPPSIKRAWWLGGAWLGLFFALGAVQAVMAVTGAGTLVKPGLGAGWTQSTLGGVLMPLIPFIGMFGVYGAMWSVRRTLKRYKAAPCGLCALCEYPLPEPPADETAVRCPECGVVRTREEHRRDWARWVGDLK